MLTQDLLGGLIQIGNYGFMLVLYVLCFVYLFYPNTEYVCLIFLLILNFFYVLLFLSDVNNLSRIDILSIEIPMKIVIILWWSSLLISNSWLINTYINLRKKFENSASGINIGENNKNIKKQILILLVCNIILFVFVHLLSIEESSSVSAKIMSKNTIDIMSKNTMKIITTLSGVALSAILFYLNDKLSTNTKIITTQ